MKSQLIPAMDYWFTTQEYGGDRRTGAFASLKERLREPTDRPGKTPRVWDWTVSVDHQHRASGTAQNQLGARAAIRKFVRTLPDQKKGRTE